MFTLVKVLHLIQIELIHSMLDMIHLVKIKQEKFISTPNQKVNLNNLGTFFLQFNIQSHTN